MVQFWPHSAVRGDVRRPQNPTTNRSRLSARFPVACLRLCQPCKLSYAALNQGERLRLRRQGTAEYPQALEVASGEPVFERWLFLPVSAQAVAPLSADRLAVLIFGHHGWMLAARRLCDESRHRLFARIQPRPSPPATASRYCNCVITWRVPTGTSRASSSVSMRLVSSIFLHMALLSSPSLFIYLEIDEVDPAPYFSSCYLVGLFDAPDSAQIDLYLAREKAWAAKTWLARQLTPKPKIDVSRPAAACKAAAYLLDDGKFLYVQNVGAEQSFGPTLYATVLELARARGLRGVIPSSEPSKILAKPKQIWKRFWNGSEYQGTVQTSPVPGHHPESWLNMAYRLAPGASLLDYDRKRAEWKAYDAFWNALNSVTDWRAHAFSMAQRSVDAHVSGTQGTSR